MKTIDTSPKWMQGVVLPRFEPLRTNLNVDVAVIGGGFTGITAAYLLKRAGRTVALLEKDQCAIANSGHTTAQLTYVTDTRLPRLVDAFGPERAQASWYAGHRAIEQIESIVRAEDIDCDFKRIPGYLHASLKPGERDERHRLQHEAALAAGLGFNAVYLESVPVMKRPGIQFSHQAKLHPLRYLRGLLEVIPGDGCHVFEDSETTDFLEGPLRVSANGYDVSCDYVIIATHVPMMGRTNVVSATLLQSKLALYSTYAIGGRLPKGEAPEAIFWDTSDPYYHLRIDVREGADEFIFGGEDHKTGQVSRTSERFANLERMLGRILPEAEVEQHWSGQVVEPNDGLPLIGETAERQFVITGFSGNGITFGTFGAMLACDAASGVGNPLHELFDIHRTTLPGGIWNYLKQNFDYPYYMVKDRLNGETESFAELKPGQGKVGKVRGERIAAHRDADGKLVMVSAVCPHMGCIVHWNDTEKTWDCPCHGSRFRATGELLAGPAEVGLKPASGSPRRNPGG